MIKTYEELTTINSFNDRLSYLQLFDNNAISPRDISGEFYKSNLWKSIREQIIDRDLGFDLGKMGVYIIGPMFVHHINPINRNDIIYQTSKLTDPNNLITTSQETHNLIHYRQTVKEKWTERRPGDTILW